jgi:SAM-dependent methyltransferase
MAAEFEARGPWVTRFVVDGHAFGGTFDVESDSRIAQFQAAFPNARTILELGSLEGGHTVRLAGIEGVTRVIGLEGRAENIARAEFVLQLLDVSNAQVTLANLQTFDLAALGSFDAVFNCGLLYHLPEPWELLARVAGVTECMYLSTHYCDDDAATTTERGYRGCSYQEFGYEDPLSGLGPSSFWPTRDALLAMVATAGFPSIEVISEEPDHPNGPIIGLAARVHAPLGG